MYLSIGLSIDLSMYLSIYGSMAFFSAVDGRAAVDHPRPLTAGIQPSINIWLIYCFYMVITWLLYGYL